MRMVYPKAVATPALKFTRDKPHVHDILPSTYPTNEPSTEEHRRLSTSISGRSLSQLLFHRHRPSRFEKLLEQVRPESALEHARPPTARTPMFSGFSAPATLFDVFHFSSDGWFVCLLCRRLFAFAQAGAGSAQLPSVGGGERAEGLRVRGGAPPGGIGEWERLAFSSS